MRNKKFYQICCLREHKLKKSFSVNNIKNINARMMANETRMQKIQSWICGDSLTIVTTTIKIWIIMFKKKKLPFQSHNQSS